MSEEYKELTLVIVMGVLSAVTGTGWYARQRWLVRKGFEIIAMVVENLAKNEVEPLKQRNVDDGGRRDLTPDQGRAVMEKAKAQVKEVALLTDENTPFHYPKVSQLLSKDPELEAKVQLVVEERKKGKRWNVGKKRFE